MFNVLKLYKVSRHELLFCRRMGLHFSKCPKHHHQQCNLIAKTTDG